MSIYSSHTDEELVLLIQQEKVDAFAEVYNRYWDKLYNSTYKRIRNNEVCEEIVQEVFVKYWAKRSITLNTGLSNYLYTAVKHGVIDFHRKSVVRSGFIKDSLKQEVTDNSNEENIYVRDLMQLINGIVELLPLKCRNVYQLSRNEHKTNREIAEILGISEKTVEGHLTKALQILRHNINDVAILLLAFLMK